jgi:Ca2+-binding RTX toxin-like protein
MTTFTGTASNDVANATSGTLTGFTGGTVAQLQDPIGDVINGLAGTDTVVAGPGADTITGGAAADNLTGGLGADIFIVGAVADLAAGETVNGTAEAGTDDTLQLNAAGIYNLAPFTTISNVDVISFGVNAAGFNLTVGNNQVSSADSNNDSTPGDLEINAAVALTQDVTINASSLTGGNRIVVDGTNLGGTDAVTGGAGNDSIDGGRGADTIVGGGGNDTIFGDGFVPAPTLTPTAAGYLTANHDLINVLGVPGPAGFGHSLLAFDDGSTLISAPDITSVFGAGGLNFLGTSYTSLYINTNGNISFGSAFPTYTPNPFPISTPVIAPFFADVDTSGAANSPTPGGNSAGSNRVWYWADTVNHVFTVTWDDVDHYLQSSGAPNAFQLQLIDEGNGDFDIVFRYEAINWTFGDASSGIPALAGYNLGDGVRSYQLPQSLTAAMSTLPSTIGNTGTAGVYIFEIRNGDTIDGGSGNDAIDAGGGIDTVNGGTGDDTITGGADADSLTGGLGADTFIIAALTDLPSGETINGTAEAATDDTLLLNTAGTYNLAPLTTITNIDAISFGVDAAGFNLTVGNNQASTADANNDSTLGDLEINAALAMTNGVIIDASGLTGSNKIIVVGTNLGGADAITGGAGNDTIDGGDGADTITGGAGADSLVGGLGADTFVVGAVADLAAGETIDGTAEAGSDDTLRLNAAGTYNLSSFTTISNIDAISFGTNAASFNLTVGNSQASTADANNDSTPGDLEINAALAMTNGVTVDASGLTGSNGIVVVGTNLGGNDTVTGGAGNDIIDGGAGTDSITGGAGNETITGGAGADSLIGGLGADTFVIVAGGVTAGETIDGTAEAGTDDTLQFNLAGTFNLSTFTTISNIDVISFGVDAAGFNLTVGNNQVSSANANNDSTAGDLEFNAAVALTNDVTISASGLTGGNRIVVAGTNLGGNDTVTGGAGADIIDGGAGTDSINGGAGSDTITGGAGADNLVGGTGADIFIIGAVTDLTGDTINGTVENATDDTLRLNAPGTYNLAPLTTITNIDVISFGVNASGFNLSVGDVQVSTANANNDTAIGDLQIDAALAMTNGVTIDASTVTGANRITVVGTNLGGDDTISGGAGNDDVAGGAGSDVINTNVGADSITPGAGNDTVDGGANNDTINYSGAWIDYTISLAGAIYTITDNRAGSPDGTDNVTNVEMFNFSNGNFFVTTILNDAPTNITLSPAAISEAAANGAVVGALTRTDPDTSLGDTATFSLLDSAGGAFAISGSNLIVANGAALDRETAATRSVTVRVTDAKGAIFDKQFTITVTDVNDNAPVITTAATQSVAENTTLVAALTSTDADSVGTNPATFSITGGADAALFAISGGNLVFQAPRDYETNAHTYQVQVSAFDGANTTAKTITVNLTDANDNAPVITTAATQTVAENATFVAALTATDVDTVGTNPANFSITGGADAALFAISGGNLVFQTPRDYETNAHSYAVQVTANDGANSTNKTITVNLTDLNDTAPVITTAATQTVAENTTFVAALTSTDADTVGTNPANFSITGGADAALFAISGGNLVFQTARDYETNAHSYQVEVSASDGVNTTPKTITVNLTDVNDNAPVITTAATQTVAENTTFVAALTSTDADTVGTNPASFSITGGAHAALFAISGGNLVFQAARDYETNAHSYQVEVSASDGVNTTPLMITVNITDDNDNAPVITTAATQTVAENTTFVAALTSTDVDTVGTNPANFSITGGADAALFAISGGNLVFQAARDYETNAHSYQVEVSASDGVNTTPQTITVNLTDENDNAPLITTAATQTVAENTTFVAALTSTDADTVGTNPATFSISGGADAALFAISGGNLVFQAARDYETNAHSYQVEVSAFDGVNTTPQTITVNLTDANDNAPVITTAATQSVPENATFVAALTSTDVDTVGTNPGTFSITGGADAALFAITGGNLVFQAARDYESNAHSYQVEVSASDGVNTTPQTITVNLTDENDNAPLITAAATQTVAENTTFVAALTSTDADTIGTNPASFSITGGADAALFAISGGNLVFQTPRDYETNAHTYQVQVSAFDGANTTAKTITVNLTDANDNAPVITTAATQTVAENTTFVAALTATDVDTVGTHPATFSITGGADAALFAITGGNLVFQAARDYETHAHSYQVEVSASDGVNTTPQTITVNLTDANDKAPVITTAATQTVAENTTFVAALTSTDADTVGTNPASFSITGGADAALFTISGGNLVFQTARDYETNAHTYQVEVSASDAVNTTPLMITVNLTDENENDNAPVITTAATQSVAENTTFVAALTSTDADTSGINPAIFSITGGVDAALFAISGGNLVFQTARDYESNAHTYQVEVSAFDGVNTTPKLITVNLTDANDNAPVITTAATQSVAENTIFVAALTSTDADTVGTNPGIFSITGGGRCRPIRHLRRQSGVPERP